MKPRSRQTALMPGNEDKVGYWLTPGYVPGDPQTAPYTDLMAELQAEFDFDFDAAPYPRPAGFDGLKETWGQRTWCNPPFVRGIAKWADKAILENQAGKASVLIAPIDRWMFRMLSAGAELRLVGDVNWLHPDGGKRRWVRYFQPNVLFILRPKP